MTPRPLVVVGLVGATLDSRAPADRWSRWRPTVSLCQQPDLVVDRLVLLHQRRYRKLVDTLTADLASVSPETEVQPVEIELADPWDLAEVYGALFDFARDFPFDPEAEDYLVHITTGTHVEQICLFLLAETRYLPARLVQTSPGRDPETRAQGRATIIDLDLSKYDQLAGRFLRQQAEGLSALKAGIDTKNPAFNALIERIERVAVRSTDPILLTGATGTGKSALARRIYALRRHRRLVEGPLVEVNCATLRGEAASSTLFGHVRGAFTGAVEARAGRLKAADGGVLFLDEVGELDLEVQAMLLRALEDGVFYPVGADREETSRFQLLAGTNRDLAAEVVAGRFREDLFARIDLWHFTLPHLAQRLEDLPPNLDFELARLGAERNLNLTMSAEARDLYLAAATAPEALWSGNFRDLGASVRRMATLAEGGRISAGDVEEELAHLQQLWTKERRARAAVAAAGPAPRGPPRSVALGLGGSAPPGPLGGAVPEDPVVRVLGPDAAADLDRFDRAQLAEVLAVCARSRSLAEAGRALFASSRRRRKRVNDSDRVRKYLAKFGLEGDAVLAGGTSAP